MSSYLNHLHPVYTQSMKLNSSHPQLSPQNPNKNTQPSSQPHIFHPPTLFHNYRSNYTLHQDHLLHFLIGNISLFPKVLRRYKNLRTHTHNHKKRPCYFTNSVFYFEGTISYDLLHLLIYTHCVVLTFSILIPLRVNQGCKHCQSSDTHNLSCPKQCSWKLLVNIMCPYLFFEHGRNRMATPKYLTDPPRNYIREPKNP